MSLGCPPPPPVAPNSTESRANGLARVSSETSNERESSLKPERERDSEWEERAITDADNHRHPTRAPKTIPPLQLCRQNNSTFADRPDVSFNEFFLAKHRHQEQVVEGSGKHQNKVLYAASPERQGCHEQKKKWRERRTITVTRPSIFFPRHKAAFSTQGLPSKLV